MLQCFLCVLHNTGMNFRTSQGDEALIDQLGCEKFSSNFLGSGGGEKFGRAHSRAHTHAPLFHLAEEAPQTICSELAVITGCPVGNLDVI